MPNVWFAGEDEQPRDCMVAHIAEFNFKYGFQSSGVMRRLEWYYCISGTGHLRMGEREFDLHAGVMFCSDGPIFRELWCNDDESLQAIMMGCVGKKISPLMEVAMGGLNRAFSPTNGDAILSIAQSMMDCAAAYEPLAQTICSDYLQVLMTTIRQGRILIDRDDQDNFSTYLKCKRHVDENFGRISHVEEVAIEMDISHEYMCRLFKRHNQFTPHAYMLRLKMSSALNRLQTSKQSVKSIAYEQGFASASAFSKAFKRVMGISPQFIREKKSEE